MIGKRSDTPRSVEIRRRRMAQTEVVKKAPDRRRQRKTVQTRLTTPPVVARHPWHTAPVERPARKVRRRVDVPLNGRGTEISLPALPRLQIGARVISFILSAIVAYALYQYWTLPAFRVDHVEITGLSNLTPVEVETALNVAGHHIIELDAHKLRDDILKGFSEIASAQVKLGLPNHVMITVTERIPVLVWIQDGRKLFVDQDGWSFPVRREELMAGYPVVLAEGAPPAVTLETPAGEPASEEEASNPVAEAGELEVMLGIKTPVPQPQNQVRRLLTPDLVAGVLQMARQAPLGAVLVYHPEHGLGWKDQAGWDVYLGDGRDLELKLLMYQAIVQRLQAARVIPVFISVENVHTPYFMVKQ